MNRNVRLNTTFEKKQGFNFGQFKLQLIGSSELMMIEMLKSFGSAGNRVNNTIFYQDLINEDISKIITNHTIDVLNSLGYNQSDSDENLYLFTDCIKPYINSDFYLLLIANKFIDPDLTFLTRFRSFGNPNVSIKYQLISDLQLLEDDNKDYKLSQRLIGSNVVKVVETFEENQSYCGLSVAIVRKYDQVQSTKIINIRKQEEITIGIIKNSNIVFVYFDNHFDISLLSDLENQGHYVSRYSVGEYAIHCDTISTQLMYDKVLVHYESNNWDVVRTYDDQRIVDLRRKLT